MHNKKPNIVFILIDDLGWKDIACYGSEFYETPNLDKLALEGMRFTDAYAACPVCSPTRASIMSGKYPATVGVTDWIGAHIEAKLIDAPYIDHLPLEEKTIASSLRDGGYHTWHIGKWHLGEQDYYPQHQGFDVNIGGCHWGHPREGYFSPYNIENLENGPDGEYLIDRITNEAIGMIKNVDEEKPFFMNLWYYAVHTPIQAKEEDIRKFTEKARLMGIDKIEPFELGEIHPTAKDKDIRIKRRVIQSDPEYAAMLYCLDYNIGRLIDTLEETGKLDDTIIIFTSDNGGLATAEGSPTCNAPLNEGKGWMYEGGVREPLIVKWKGRIKEGSVCKEAVISPDFYPTMLEMAGLPLIPDQHVDGESILPLLEGEDKLEREAIYWHYPHYGNQGGTPGSSIRMGQYKLIEFFEDGRTELYDLVTDIGEENDIASEKPELRDMMKSKLEEWRISVEALIPGPNPNYNDHTIS